MILQWLLTAALGSAHCPDVQGASALFDPRRARIIWFGETHGTREAPAMFGDLVCAASATGRPVIVALERGLSEQGLWDAFLDSDGGPDAEATLLSGREWASRDGRSSRAILDLAQSLRRLKAEGRNVSVRMIMPRPTDGMTTDQYEGAMASAVADAAGLAPRAQVLAYSGWRHAAKQAWTSNGATYRAAADHLPPSEVLAVKIQSAAGAAWNCWGDEGCGPHPFTPDDSTDHARGVVIGQAPQGFDAVAYAGTGATASPPAARADAGLPPPPGRTSR